MIKVVVPSVWSPNGRTDYDAEEGPLPDVIRRFADEHPGYRRRLLDDNGEPHRYVNVCVDDAMIPRHARASTTVEAGSTVTFVAPMAGG